MPVEKFKGSELFSGTLNLTGRVEARATKIGADTTLARIVHLVEAAQATKAPTQGIITAQVGQGRTVIIVAHVDVKNRAPPDQT